MDNFPVFSAATGRYARQPAVASCVTVQSTAAAQPLSAAGAAHEASAPVYRARATQILA